MRVATLTRRLIVLTVLGWVAYQAVLVTSGYLETARLVERILADATAKPKAVAERREARRLFLDSGRLGLEAAARERGWSDREIEVSPTPSGVRVSVAWSHPLLTWDSRPLLPLPVSVRRWVSVDA